MVSSKQNHHKSNSSRQNIHGATISISNGNRHTGILVAPPAQRPSGGHTMGQKFQQRANDKHRSMSTSLSEQGTHVVTDDTPQRRYASSVGGNKSSRNGQQRHRKQNDIEERDDDDDYMNDDIQEYDDGDSKGQGDSKGDDESSNGEQDHKEKENRLVKKNNTSVVKYYDHEREKPQNPSYKEYCRKIGMVDDDNVQQETIRRTVRMQAWKHYKIVEEKHYLHDSDFASFMLEALGVPDKIIHTYRRKEFWIKIKKHVCEGMQAARSSATQTIKKRFIGTC